ncbi:hypothetical protein AH312_04515 [Salmonella enterica subsp. enterica]|nr:hypothetical protein [Salmonella enterica subsp. enterica serovar Soumbedioune]EEC0857318.1 hypothetical protein [Salmonella enterica subsp. enterica serovar Soumbedioune]EEO8661616.1 hypothetical protein [Salmonella enterica subsp. enterica serovar Rubislaw]
MDNIKLIDIDEELKKIRMLDRIQVILDKTRENNGSVKDFIWAVQYEVDLIEAKVELNNKQARDALVRHKLGLSNDDVIPSRAYVPLLMSMAWGGYPKGE